MEAVLSPIPELAARPIIVDWRLGFEQPMTIQACDYWQRCCKGRAMPSRADLEFRAMCKFVPHLALIEIRPPIDGRPDYFIRLAGTQCESVFGNVTGRPLSEAVPPEIGNRWRSVMDQVVAAKAAVRVDAGMEFQNKTWLETEMLVAPLGDGVEVTMLLVCFTARSCNNSPAG